MTFELLDVLYRLQASLFTLYSPAVGASLLLAA